MDVLGYVPPMTHTNEMYVATLKIEGWLRDGYNEEEIATIWNSGSTEHKVGVNKHGIPFNTYAYAKAVLNNL